MTKNKSLAAVPDTSMLSLYKALVGFLVEEAEARSWSDVRDRLRAVDAALRERGPEA